MDLYSANALYLLQTECVINTDLVLNIKLLYIFLFIQFTMIDLFPLFYSNLNLKIDY